MEIQKQCPKPANELTFIEKIFQSIADLNEDAKTLIDKGQEPEPLWCSGWLEPSDYEVYPDLESMRLDVLARQESKFIPTIRLQEGYDFKDKTYHSATFDFFLGWIDGGYALTFIYIAENVIKSGNVKKGINSTKFSELEIEL